MTISLKILFLSLALTIACFLLGVLCNSVSKKKDAGDFAYTISFFSGIVCFVYIILQLLFGCFAINNGEIGLVTNFGNSKNFSGKVITKPGFHFTGKGITQDLYIVNAKEQIDPVHIQFVKKDQSNTNIEATVNIKYKISPNKAVEIFSNNSNYRKTLIELNVNKIILNNSDLNNNGTISETTKNDITKTLKEKGLIVSDIVVSDYKLTNINNLNINK